MYMHGKVNKIQTSTPSKERDKNKF